MSPSQARKNGGFAIAMTLFILVIFSLLMAALWYSFTASQEESALDSMQTRAFLAAKAGSDIGLYKSLIDGVCANYTIQKGQLPELPDWRVELYCSKTILSENGQPVEIHSWKSVSCNTSVACGSSTDGAYVSKTITTETLK